MVKDAGLYWYHPHVMSAAAVGNGLYGALLVEDPADGVGVEDQLTIVLSDIGFDDKGVLEPADSGGSAGTVFGREGAYVLVNGRTQPAAAGALRRAAALAHRERRQEPLLPAGPRRDRTSPSSAPTAGCRSAR